MLALLPLLLQAAAPAAVSSAAPDAVAVTVYRNPMRQQGQALDLGWLNGQALITETRTVDLPAGPAQIRFEGVADGIVPVSAIVTGLPGGTVEKNRDARLLSPAALVDGTLGRIVTIRRTDRRSGAVREEEARIVAGPQGGVVLQTAGGGVLALGCSGLGEKPLYGSVPEGLSARPTLSVTTVSPAAGKATVRLSYLADLFDWQADYIGRLSEDRRTLDLFAWLTLANGGSVSFVEAETMAVAGRVERDEEAQRGDMPQEVQSLSLQCWPMGSTTDGLYGPPAPSAPPPPPPPPMAQAMMTTESIVVTARRNSVPVAAIMTSQENLGDLKLYRIPEPVTVAANSQKQVALLTRPHVPYATIHSFVVERNPGEEARPATLLLRVQNREKDGLGLPLPAGRIAVMAPHGESDIVVGQGEVADTAVGQEANLSIGTSHQVQAVLTEVGEGRWHYAVSNANPFAVEVEAVFAFGQPRFLGAAAKLPRRNGLPLWKIRLPANASRSIAFGTQEPKED